MILLEETKKIIISILDSEEFKIDLYAGLTEDKRKELGQVYTPADICIKMIESFTVDSFVGKTVLDPACGSGNLLIACLIAGADVDKIFGNEYDEAAVNLCRKRINKACDILGLPHINDWQIHVGDATIPGCLNYFGPDYKKKLEEYFYDAHGPSLFPMLSNKELELLNKVGN